MKFSEVSACAIALMTWGRKADGTEGGTTAPTADPPGYDDLRRFLLALPPTTLYLLAAVAYLGGSEFGPGQLVDVLLRVGRKFPTRTSLVDVLTGPLPLAECLGDGLRKLTAARVNLDKLHAGTC